MSIDDHFFKQYKPKTFIWDRISFDRRMLRVDNDLRFPIVQSTPQWNDLKSRMKSIEERGIRTYLNKKGKIFAITNLDVVLGVGFEILNPSKYDYGTVSFDPVSKAEVKQLNDLNHINFDRKYCIDFLNLHQYDHFKVIRVREKISYSSLSNPRERTSFLFTLESGKHQGYIAMESIEENTATHLFAVSWENLESYYTTLARIRQYLTSRIINKREQLYRRENSFSHDQALHHKSTEQWKRELIKKLGHGKKYKKMKNPEINVRGLLSEIQKTRKGLDQIYNSLGSKTVGKRTDALRGEIKKLEDSLQLAYTNSPAQVEGLQNQIKLKGQYLKAMIAIEEENKALIAAQTKFLSRHSPDGITKGSSLISDYLIKTHTLLQQVNLFKARRRLLNFLMEKSVQEKVGFINDILKLHGKEKFQCDDDHFGSEVCPDFSLALDKALIDDVELLIHALRAHNYTSKQFAPLDLLRLFVSHYNKKGRTHSNDEPN